MKKFMTETGPMNPLKSGDVSLNFVTLHVHRQITLVL